MSVKEPYQSDWKERVRTRIRRSDGVIALISRNTLASSGELWEIRCAREEGKKLIGLWIYSHDQTRPPEMEGVASSGGRGPTSQPSSTASSPEPPVS